MSTHISKLHDTQLSEGRDDLAANLIRYIELGQGHVLRPEQRFLVGRHLDRPLNACYERSSAQMKMREGGEEGEM